MANPSGKHVIFILDHTTICLACHSRLRPGGSHAGTGHVPASLQAIRGDKVGHVVSWKGNANVRALEGKPVCLRFLMRGTRLYAFQFTNH